MRRQRTQQQDTFAAEQGMVSVETALTTPVIVLALLALLLACRIGFMQIKACSLAAQQSRQQQLEQQFAFGEVAILREAEGGRITSRQPVTVTLPMGRLWGFELPPVRCTMAAP